jgi:hypothetical protein
MFHTRVVGAKTLEQLLLGEDLPTAGIGGYVSYVGRRSRRRQSKAIERWRYILLINRRFLLLLWCLSRLLAKNHLENMAEMQAQSARKKRGHGI